jgi:ABC-type sugar transport system permease subunit
MKKRHQQKLVVVSLFLLISLNLPLLLLFDSSEAFMGVPLFYIYVFSIWMISIMVSIIIVNRYYE